MLFPDAGEIWLASRTPYISPKTFHEYELNLRTLGKAFRETKLREITADVFFGTNPADRSILSSSEASGTFSGLFALSMVMSFSATKIMAP